MLELASIIDQYTLATGLKRSTTDLPEQQGAAAGRTAWVTRSGYSLVLRLVLSAIIADPADQYTCVPELAL